MNGSTEYYALSLRKLCQSTEGLMRFKVIANIFKRLKLVIEKNEIKIV